jgi:apolipoprotein N-acyltransferase
MSRFRLFVVIAICAFLAFAMLFAASVYWLGSGSLEGLGVGGMFLSLLSLVLAAVIAGLGRLRRLFQSQK